MKKNKEEQMTKKDVFLTFLKFIFSKQEEKERSWEKIKNHKIQKIIKKNKLDPDKANQMIQIVKRIKNDETIIAVCGEQGTGKTTVINQSIKNISLPKKGFINSFMLILLYFIWIFSWVRYEWKLSIDRKIAKRRWKIINLNIWNIFGHRNLGEYKNIKDTAYGHDCSLRECKKTCFKKGDITSYNYKEGKSSVSWLFLKKAIWRAIFSKIKNKNNFISRLKNSIFLNSYALNKETAKFRIIIIHIVLILLFSLLIGGPIFALLYIQFDWKIATKYSPLSIIFGLGMEFFIKPLVKNIEVHDDNKFFVDPISNTAIEKYIAKLSKRKKYIFHISEIDRFSDEIGEEGDQVIRYIIESVSLAYKAKNIDIIFEINEKIKKISSRNVKNVYLNKDKANKMFDQIIRIKSFDLKSIGSSKEMSYAQMELFKGYFKAMVNISGQGQNHIMSWRLLNRHWELFQTVNAEIFSGVDIDEIIKKGIGINQGFEDIYKSVIQDEFRINKRINERTTVELKRRIEILYGKNIEKDKSVWSGLFIFTNPHIPIPKKTYTISNLFVNEKHNDLFVSKYANKLNGNNLMDQPYLAIIIYSLNQEQIEKIFDNIDYGDFWKKELTARKGGRNITKEEFYNHMPLEVQRKLLGELQQTSLMKNEWVLEFAIENFEILKRRTILYLIKTKNVLLKDLIDLKHHLVIAQNFKFLSKELQRDFIEEINQTKNNDVKKIFRNNRKGKVSVNDIEKYERLFWEGKNKEEKSRRVNTKESAFEQTNISTLHKKAKKRDQKKIEKIQKILDA